MIAVQSPANESLATQDLVDSIATELACGIDRAVESWMAQIEEVMNDHNLTTLGRLQAVREVMNRYKTLTGKTAIACRRM
jgi:acetyl-CoA carboxylase alpha subunit